MSHKRALHTAVTKMNVVSALHRTEAVVQHSCSEIHKALADLIEWKATVDLIVESGLQDQSHPGEDESKTITTMIERLSYMVEVMTANTLADTAES